jgi:hypothetical protein|tara:strand:+ start:386 stop:871 length:486 start_codon:yes stop_codon:yes gene_type:complete
MAFQNHRSPNLPIPPRDYDERYFLNLIRSIGLYFSVQDSKAGINVDSVVTDVIQLPFGAFAAANGANNNIALPSKSFIRITGPTGAFSISGIAKPANPDGRVVILYNTTVQHMTITDDATSTAENRILTNTGADVVTTGTGIVSLIYSVTDARWILLTSLL